MRLKHIIHESLIFVQSLGGLRMQEFDIAIHSFEEVQDFVALATVQPFEISVGNNHQRVNGKSFMGMFSLDYSQPVHVRAQCSDEEFNHFRTVVDRYVVK